MAAQAFRVKSEVGKLFIFYNIIGDEFRLMAGNTVFLCVRTYKSIACKAMVEFVFCQTNKLESLSMVIVMAGYTVFAGYF